MPQEYYSILMMVAMFAFLYFFMMRPQKKKEKAIAEMRSNLKVGDNVITIGGVVGTIVILKEDYVTIETSGMKTRLEFTKWGISSVNNITPGE